MKYKKSPTILITGGHLTPAVATIEALRAYSVNIVFVGRKVTSIDGTPAQEQKAVEALGIPFIPFTAPKFYRKPFHLNFSQIPSVFSSLSQAQKILKKYSPDVVVTFGGYLALPIALVAKLKGISVIVHEQTSVMGITNQLLSSFASKTYISWPNTKGASSKAQLVGNPIRAALKAKAETPNWYLNPKKYPILFITGGNQGSIAINEQIENLLDEITQKYFVVHQSGSARNEYSLQRLRQKQTKLPVGQKENYIVKAWFTAEEVSWLLSHSALVISRSGANTVTELLTHKSRAIVIPLPISARKEQQTNARVLKDLGLATVLDQNHLNNLGEVILQMMSEQKLSIDHQKIDTLQQLHHAAADKLAKEIISCANLPNV